MSNCSNAPVEALDMDFDYFRILEYSLRQDSGGDGRSRGGLGICRRYEILTDGVQYAMYGDRFRLRPEGLFAGHAGEAASCTLLRDGEATALPSKTSMLLRKGDVLEVRTGGGAGFGPPEERSSARILEDVEDGFVSPGQAMEIYGYEA